MSLRSKRLLLAWFDNAAVPATAEFERTIDWLRTLPQQSSPLSRSARQGFYWWEIDITYYALRALAACGLIWDLKVVPARIRDARRVAEGDRR
ncbi:MAG: hypothetical protein ABW110_17870 [Steroidobacteraceae bacterium]